MKKKAGKGGGKRKKHPVLSAAPVIDVDFPQAGSQDCFDAAVGTPFIAYGDKPGDGYVVVGARLLYYDNGNLTSKTGTLFAFADFAVSGGFLTKTGYTAHKPIENDANTEYGADTKWAVGFSDVADLPVDEDLFLIVRAADYDGTTETTIRFRHVPPTTPSPRRPH